VKSLFLEAGQTLNIEKANWPPSRPTLILNKFAPLSNMTACQPGGGQIQFQIQIGSAARFRIHSIRVSLLGERPACCGAI
jgi:hypothetical protein